MLFQEKILRWALDSPKVRSLARHSFQTAGAIVLGNSSARLGHRPVCAIIRARAHAYPWSVLTRKAGAEPKSVLSL